MFRVSVLLFAWALGLWGSDASAATINTKPLGRWPEGKINFVLISGDACHLAICATGADGVTTLAVDGVTQRVQSGVKELAMSADASRTAYAFERGGHIYVVDGATTSEAFDDDQPILALSADGKHFAYSAKSSGIWQIVVDHKHVDVSDEEPWIEFSPDGTRLAYRRTVSMGAAREGQWQVVVDGIAGPVFRDVPEPVAFSANSKRLGYLGYTDNGVLPVIDGVATAAKGYAGDPVFSPDSEHVGYTLFRSPDVPASGAGGNVANGRGDEPLVVVDGKETLVPLANIQYTHLTKALSFCWSGDSRHFAYIRATDYSAAMVPMGRAESCSAFLDGKLVGDGFDVSRDLVLSTTGKYIAYATYGGFLAHRGEAVVFNGKIGPWFGGVSGPAFSLDEKHVAYAATKGGAWDWHMEVADIVSGKTEAIEAYSVVLFRRYGLSDDSVPEDNNVPFRISADGMLRFIGRKGDELLGVSYGLQP